MGLAALIIASTCYAQDNIINYHYSVKVYAQAIFYNYDQLKYNYRQQTVKPTFAFQVQNRKHNFHEVELTDISIDHTKDKATRVGTNLTIDGLELTKTTVMLQYEYIINILKKKKSRISPMIGFAGAPYYIRSSFIPFTTADVPYKNTNAGLNIYIVPRVIYNISPRFYLDLNIPVTTINFYHESITRETPTLKQQVYTESGMEIFPSTYSVRIGLGLRF